MGAWCVCASAGVGAQTHQSVSDDAVANIAAQRMFVEAMARYQAKDFRGAEILFRQLLEHDPQLLRVRLELARALFMQKKDEQADYHFRFAAAQHPEPAVTRNIVRFRNAIRSRRAWRFNVNFGIAPDTNINSATNRETVDIYGLPFRLDPTARARSGTGQFIGGDGSLRLNRDRAVPIYLAAYGRWLRYRADRFDDLYVGAEAGPEFQVSGGRLRTTATWLMRRYGHRPLVSSIGTRLEFEKVMKDNWTMDATLLVRRNDYARRSDVDGREAEARISVERPLGATALGYVYAGLGRNWAQDDGQALTRQQLGLGIVKEIGWGLRPQVGIELSHQAGNGPLAPFGRTRRDWRLQGSFGIYKRDWNVQGFAPSINITATRTFSTLSIFDEKRVRSEIRLTKAF